MAEEQAALRRVATLVAAGAAPENVFAAVTEEVARLLPVEFAILGRYESDNTVAAIAAWGAPLTRFPVGSRWSLDGKNLVTIVLETARPARVDHFEYASGPLGVVGRESGFHSTVGTPIVVEGRLWGVMCVGSTLTAPLLPQDTEPRLVSFTELLATAVANAESRAGLARLADEQAALRRVATQVARGATPEEVFAVVTEEVGRLLPVEFAGLGRYEHDSTLTIVSSWSRTDNPFQPVGSHWILGGKNVGTLVFETGRPARLDGDAAASGPLAVAAQQRHVKSRVGTPILVEGHLWGMIGAGTSLEGPLPTDTESRLSRFTELVAMGIANAESRAELTASRARIVAAADETRRRIQRDLHDETQQQLVSLMLELRAAQATERPEVGELMAQLATAERALGRVLGELREIASEIHPAMLSKGGLERALRALARRSPVPVTLDLRRTRRMPEHVEVAVYYVVSEALSNSVKHAHASAVDIDMRVDETIIRLAIRDDGIGGADAGHGSGLIGLSDRIQALGGTLHLTSPAGGGTTLLIEIPLQGDSGAPEP
ncbi:MAG TPA: GAF domain-containing sensor histidine kinase [Solirubrobacteraceae bacterium]|nr:GAF domain-containing sensor histidine kinase [Solirubrobacteraceae bacterium]